MVELLQSYLLCGYGSLTRKSFDVILSHIYITFEIIVRLKGSCDLCLQSF